MQKKKGSDLQYGQLMVKRENGAQIPMRAHRLSYEMHKGAIPKGMMVCHACDVTLSVNPDHLFLGDNGANMRDCAAKGRLRPHAGAMASAVVRAKLTPNDVLAIRASDARTGILASRYGVSTVLIRNIKHRKVWKHV